MTDLSLVALLRRIHDALSSMNVPFALVGGLAVSVRAEPRFTRDVDVMVAVENDHEAERLIRSLRPYGFVPFALVEQAGTERLATARLRDNDGMVCDLILAATGIEGRIVRAATPTQFVPGLCLPIATVEHLVVMKILSVAKDRPQDDIDLAALLAEGPNLQAVREDLHAITAAGTNRQQDLFDKLDRQLMRLGEDEGA